MKTPPLFLIRSTLLVICVLTPPILCQAQTEDPLQSYPTVESRKKALADLIGQRTGLAESGSYEQLVELIQLSGEFQLRLFDLNAALASANEAREIATRFRGTEKENLYIDALVFSARVYIRRDEIRLAFPLLDEALTLSERRHYRAGEAATYLQFGLAYNARSEYQKAIESNDKAIAISRELNNKRAEAEALVMQGETYMLADKQQECAETLKTAETKWRELNDRRWIAWTLFDLNFLAMRQGQWQTALNILSVAEPLVTDKEAEPYLAGELAVSYGLIYEVYGQLETSHRYLNESLTYYRDGAHDKAAAVDSGNHVVRVKAKLGDYAGAKAQSGETLALAKEIEKDLYIGLSYEGLGFVLLREEKPLEAKLAFESALNYFQLNQRPWARVQTYLGQTEFLLGNLALAANAYGKALRFFQDKNVLDYTNEAALRFRLGKLALKQRNFALAEEHLQRSIDLTKFLRENASSKDLKSSFLDSVHDRFEAYVEVLMANYFQKPDHALEVRAFEASESGRALALLDSLYAHHRELKHPSDPALLVQETQLQKDEQRLVDELAQLVSRNSAKSAIEKVSKELADVRSRYEALQARINTSSKFANLLRPTVSYENIRQQLTDSNSSLLEYSLGETNSFAWLITKDGIQSYKLADKQTIERAANTLIQRLEKPSIDSAEDEQLQAAIDEMSRLVLEQVSNKLRTTRLIVVADGALQYVPFQVLKAFPTAPEPLVAQFDIVDAPSASALLTVRQERMRRNPGDKMVVGFGDAVFSSDYSPDATGANSGFTRSNESNGSKPLPPLFNAKRELKALGDLAGTQSAFYVKYEATRDNLLKVDLSQYRILHVVTHGIINDVQPELSGLYLSLVDASDRPINGFVGLADIYKLHAPVDLVVLSACHTARGRKLRGEGLIGVTRGFMYAGASSVVASLWQADDAATAELMKHFYTFMLHDGLTPSAALRAAQNKIRAQKKWRSPYYWAAFVIQGDDDLNLKAPKAVVNRSLAIVIGTGALCLLLLALGYWYLRGRRVRRGPVN